MRLVLRLLICLPLLATAGCASFGATSGAKDHGAMSCAELNEEMAKASVSLSGVASRRAQSQNQRLSRWVVGGEQVKSVLNERRAAEIDRLRADERAIERARRAKGC
jgi:hypothetical protein